MLTRVQQGLEKCLDVANSVQVGNLGRQLDALLDILQLLIRETRNRTSTRLTALRAALANEGVDKLEEVLLLND